MDADLKQLVDDESLPRSDLAEKAYLLGYHAFWENFPSKKVEKWKKEQNKKVLEKQKQASAGNFHGCSQPYYGAIGGAYTYSMTPTTLGTVYTVENAVTKETLDVTDYNDW